MIGRIDEERTRGNFREWAKFTDHARRLVERSGRTVLDDEIASNVLARTNGDGGRQAATA